uniref:Uncharacterized protein n=1 Tax=Rhizophora mucronata TaxID=61149 RepID=A0A2P2NE21_RHIMU
MMNHYQWMYGSMLFSDSSNSTLVINYGIG